MYSSGITQQLFDACFIVMPFLPWFYHRADLKYLDGITFSWRLLYWKKYCTLTGIAREILVCFYLRSMAILGEGNGNPPQYSCLENLVDGGAWWAAVHRVVQSRIWLKRLSMHACIGEGNATHSSISAWRTPGTEEHAGLLSLGSHRVWHDWNDLAAAAAASAL